MKGPVAAAGGDPRERPESAESPWKSARGPVEDPKRPVMIRTEASMNTGPFGHWPGRRSAPIINGMKGGQGFKSPQLHSQISW